MAAELTAVDVARPPVLDYSSRRPARVPSDRGLLLASAVVTGLIGIALLLGMADLLVATWPNFGVTLVAVPVALVAFAFFVISRTAVRSSRTSTAG